MFFTSHVVLSGHGVIAPYGFFGVDSTIRDQTHVAEGSLIGMGATITADTEPWCIHSDHAARKRMVPSAQAGV